MAMPTERTSLTGRQSRRRSVLEAALDGPRDRTGRATYVPSLDVAATGDCQHAGAVQRQRTTIFADTFEQTLKEEHPEALETLSKSFTGYLIQSVCLVATVFAYAAGAFVVSWAKTTGVRDDGKRETGDTFFEPTAVVITKLSVVLIGFAFALLADRRGGHGIEGGYFRRIFNLSELMRWAPVALGWSIADVAEVMAQGRNMDPATYTILSQSRLVGTAVVMRMVSGTTRSALQWSILTTLTLVIIGWNLLPDEFGVVKKKGNIDGQLLGLMLTFAKVFLSIVCGVFAQGLMKSTAHLPLLIQQTQICIMSAFWSAIVLVITLIVVFPRVLHKEWNYQGGVFGGEENSAGQAGFAALRPWGVILFYIYREYCTNLCVKNFDVLVKNLCNAFAAVLSYYVACLVTGDKSFNAVKGLFTIVIGMEIMHYAMAPPPVSMPTAGCFTSLPGMAARAKKLEVGGLKV